MDKIFVMESFEKRMLIGYLNDCRTLFLEENKPIEDVNDMLMKVIKAKSKRISDKVVYRMKMTDFDYRILIGALHTFKLHQKTIGVDTTDLNQLLLKVLDAYGV